MSLLQVAVSETLTYPTDAVMTLEAQVLMLVSMWGAFLGTVWCLVRVARSGRRLHDPRAG